MPRTIMLTKLMMIGLTHEVKEIGVEVKRECRGIA